MLTIGCDYHPGFQQIVDTEMPSCKTADLHFELGCCTALVQVVDLPCKGRNARRTSSLNHSSSPYEARATRVPAAIAPITISPQNCGVDV